VFENFWVNQMFFRVKKINKSNGIAIVVKLNDKTWTFLDKMKVVL